MYADKEIHVVGIQEFFCYTSVGEGSAISVSSHVNYADNFSLLKWIDISGSQSQFKIQIG